MRCGGMAEWFKAAVLKTVFRITERGFKSYSLRHVPRRVHGGPSYSTNEASREA